MVIKIWIIILRGVSVDFACCLPVLLGDVRENAEFKST